MCLLMPTYTDLWNGVNHIIVFSTPNTITLKKVFVWMGKNPYSFCILLELTMQRSLKKSFTALSRSLKRVKEKCFRSKPWKVQSTYSNCCLVLSVLLDWHLPLTSHYLCPSPPPLPRFLLQTSHTNLHLLLSLSFLASLPSLHNSPFLSSSLSSSSHQVFRHCVSLVLPLQCPGCSPAPSPSNGFPMLRPSYLWRGYVSSLGSITL